MHVLDRSRPPALLATSTPSFWLVKDKAPVALFPQCWVNFSTVVGRYEELIGDLEILRYICAINRPLTAVDQQGHIKDQHECTVHHIICLFHVSTPVSPSSSLWAL